MCRATRAVKVDVNGKGQTLRRFKMKPGQIRRYAVLYHSEKKEPLDLVIYWGRRHQEPWYFLVPSGTSLRAEEMVELYGKGMSIEQGVRDWKTHLGVRGFVFYGKHAASRLNRLLLAFSLAYLLCLALGTTEEAQAVRAFVEIPRYKPRHGTTRTLSVLSIGILRLSLKKLSRQTYKSLFRIIVRVSRGQGVIQWCLSRPKPIRVSFKT